MNLDKDDDERSRNRDRCGNVDRKNSFDSCSGSVNTSSHRQRSTCEKNKYPRSHAPSSIGSINCAEADANMLLCNINSLMAGMTLCQKEKDLKGLLVHKIISVNKTGNRRL